MFALNFLYRSLKVFIYLFLFISCSKESTIIGNDPNLDPQSGKITDSFKKIMSDEFNTDDFKFGATLNFFQLNSNVDELYLK